ncbi:unnamed protein product, partial [Polarella glacialis]
MAPDRAASETAECREPQIMACEALWVASLSQLSSLELAAAAPVCRSIHTAVLAATERILEPLFAPGSRVLWPRGLSRPEAIHRAVGQSRILVLGGEDGAELPLLHLSLVSICEEGFQRVDE